MPSLTNILIIFSLASSIDSPDKKSLLTIVSLSKISSFFSPNILLKIWSFSSTPGIPAWISSLKYVEIKI